eukprot:3060068-Heterocapsa_arctica.AAC.1
MVDVEYGKIYDIYLPPPYLRLCDGPACHVIDMWRILGRGTSAGDLAAGTTSKYKIYLRPKSAAPWQGGDFAKNDETQGNQIFCRMNECIPEVAKAMRECLKETAHEAASSDWKEKAAAVAFMGATTAKEEQLSTSSSREIILNNIIVFDAAEGTAADAVEEELEKKWKRAVLDAVEEELEKEWSSMVCDAAEGIAADAVEEEEEEVWKDIAISCMDCETKFFHTVADQ